MRALLDINMMVNILSVLRATAKKTGSKVETSRSSEHGSGKKQDAKTALPDD